jgi:membrane protease YdiL (CAAX protease family)
MITTPLLKILLPLAAIFIVILLCKYKFHYSLREDLQLRPPAAGALVIWVGMSLAWMLITDALVGWRGPWDFTVWKAQPIYITIIRVVAVCFLGPIAEEIIFRGLLFRRMMKWGKLNRWLVVTILAAVWALMHYSYTPVVVVIIFIDGLLLGAALLTSRSLVVPIAMHISWNIYAIW